MEPADSNRLSLHRPRRGRTGFILDAVRPLRGRFFLAILSAGSMTFGHSTRGYWEFAPFGDGEFPLFIYAQKKGLTLFAEKSVLII